MTVTVNAVAFGSEQADRTSAPVFICLLGSFRLFKHGKLLLTNNQKARLLLSTLALQPCQTTTRSYLLETVWPGIDPRLSGPQLRGVLFKLRRAFQTVLGEQPLILRECDDYQLNMGAGIGIDAAEFEAYIKRGDRARYVAAEGQAIRCYASALDLYHGDLLINSTTEIEIERERLRGLYLRALNHLANYGFVQKDYIACLDYAYKMLMSNPFYEEAHRIIMRCYARQRERGQALRQFQLCRDRLKAEFNIDPERETLMLYQSICAGDEDVETKRI